MSVKKSVLLEGLAKIDFSCENLVICNELMSLVSSDAVCSVKINTGLDDSIKCCVKKTLFKEAISVGAESFDVSLSDDAGHLSISKGIRSSLSIINTSEWDFKIDVGKNRSFIPKIFLKYLPICKTMMTIFSGGMVRDYKDYLLVRDTKLFATNNRIVVICELGKETGWDFFIPISHIPKIMEISPSKIYLGDPHWVSYFNDDVTFSHRRFSVINYPNCESVLVPSKKKGFEFLFPKDAQRFCIGVSSFSDGDKASVSIAGGEMSISVGGACGSIRKTFACEVDGEFEFATSIGFISNVFNISGKNILGFDGDKLYVKGDGIFFASALLRD